MKEKLIIKLVALSSFMSKYLLKLHLTYGKRTECWQMSTSGVKYLQDLELLQETLDSVNVLISKLECHAIE